MTFAALTHMARTGRAFQFNYTVSADGTNLNLRTAAVAGGWDQVQPLVAVFTINSGIYLGSGSTSTYALDTGSTAWPAGSDILIVNNGFIVGMGGAANGGAGGPALRAQVGCPISINNLGTIGGGGGGGGYGQAAGYVDKVGTSWSGGGGGGGGRGYSGGAGGGPYNPAPLNVGGGTGAAGTKTGPGGGASGGSFGGVVGGTGGTGGGLGAAGSNGGGGSSIYGVYSGPGSGGAAGAAVVGNTYITWVATGTRLGSIS